MRICLIFIVLVLVACQSNIKETPSGLRFEIIKKGDGILPRKGQVVVFNYRVTDSNDSIWIDTWRNGFPVIDVVKDSSFISKEKGLKQMLRMVSDGDSLTTTLTVAEYFNKVVQMPIPSGMDSTQRLVYRVSIDSIMSKEAYRDWSYQSKLMKRDKQLASDIKLIDEYLTTKGLNFISDESGLRYIIHEEGKGRKPISGEAVIVNYSGYTLDGKYFATNIKSIADEKGIYDPKLHYEPLTVIVDESLVIVGWHLALKLLSKGAKATFYIPSPLGYGFQKFEDIIKVNEILVFDIEVLEVR